MRFSFVADEPINKTDLDLLGFGQFVERIHAALADTATPFVYGLLGPWGSGKTSVQMLLRSRFQEDLDANKAGRWLYVPIWLDAWRYENQDNMIFPLLRAFDASRKELIPAASVAENEGFLKSLRVVAASSAVALLDLGLRATTKAAFGEAMRFKDVKDHVADVLEHPDSLAELLDKWVEQVDGLRVKYEDFIVRFATELEASRSLPPETVRFVVFIDDLDRCLPSVAVALLEAIKNHLSVERCIYILGINPDVIARGIRAKYAGLDVSGREYLEKIIHYSFGVPVPDARALERFGTENLKRLLQTEAVAPDQPVIGQWTPSALKQFGEALAESRFSNPRKIKRILNSYLHFLRNFAASEHFSLAWIARLIIVAEYYPELFAALAATREEQTVRAVLRDVNSVRARDISADAFKDKYGFEVGGMMSDFANMPNLLVFTPSGTEHERSLVDHVGAVRVVCGRG